MSHLSIRLVAAKSARLSACAKRPTQDNEYSEHLARGKVYATHHDGIVYELLDVLAEQVGAVGVFTDWPATVTYYANCMGLD